MLSFQQPSLQSSVSRDPSEILSLSILKTVVLLNMFVEMMIDFFSGLSDE